MSNFGIFACCAFLLIFIVITFTACFVIRNRRKEKIILTQDVNIQTDAVWWVYVFDLRNNIPIDTIDSAAIILQSEEDEFRIGILPDCDLCLTNIYVGRHHASIKRKGNIFTYYDKGSYAGSLSNGNRIMKIRIRNCTKIQIDQILLFFSNKSLNGSEIKSIINTLSDLY